MLAVDAVRCASVWEGRGLRAAQACVVSPRRRCGAGQHQVHGPAVAPARLQDVQLTVQRVRGSDSEHPSARTSRQQVSCGSSPWDTRFITALPCKPAQKRSNGPLNINSLELTPIDHTPKGSAALQARKKQLSLLKNPLEGVTGARRPLNSPQKVQVERSLLVSRRTSDTQNVILEK